MKIHQRLLVLSLALTLLYSLPVRAAESLEQAWALALQHDHQVAAAGQREQAAEHGVAAARANRLPALNLDAGHIRMEAEPSARINLPFLKNAALPFAQDDSSYGALTVSAPLFTAGRITHGIEAAGALSEAARAGSRQARNDMLLYVAEAYIGVLRARHMVTVAQSHLATMTKHLEDVGNLFAHGDVARHDLLASQVALSAAKQQALQADNGLALAGAAYNRLLGRSQDSVPELVDIARVDGVAPQGDVAAMVALARSGRGELQLLGKQESALQQQAASVSARQFPQIAVMGGWARLDNRYLVKDQGWWLGVAMKWELFDGGMVRREAAQIASNAQALAELRDEAGEKIELQVRQSWLSLNEANARIELVGQAVAQADETLNLARDRYRAGLGPNSEVLDAEARRAQAYANRDNAWYDRALGRLRLQHASGQLSANRQP